MDYVTVSDLLRWVTIVVSPLVAFLVVRLTYMRIVAVGNGWRASKGAYALCAGVLLLLVAETERRIERLGEPGDVYLYLYLAGLVLLTFGLASFTYWVPPWRR